MTDDPVWIADVPDSMLQPLLTERHRLIRSVRESGTELRRSEGYHQEIADALTREINRRNGVPSPADPLPPEHPSASAGVRHSRLPLFGCPHDEIHR